MRKLKLTFLITIYQCVFVTVCFAQEGIIGGAGQFTNNIGNAAAANRKAADQMLQQALMEEKQALSTFPPNIALLAKAGASARAGLQADNQSRHFAQASMNAINTGNQSGQFDTKNYGGMSEEQIKQLATSSSPYAGQVKSNLASWGIQVDESGNNIQLPLGMGKISLDIAMTQMETGMKAAAKLLGYDPNEVSKGLLAAQQDEQKLAAKVAAEINSANQASEASVKAEDRSPAESSSKVAPSGEELSATQNAQLEAQSQFAAPGGVEDAEERSILFAMEESKLGKFRSELVKKLGVDDFSVKGNADQDIFKMVHIRYQVIRRLDGFIESSDHVIASGQ